MFAYYLSHGLRQLRRSPWLTLLIILTLAAGVSMSMATTTVLHLMSADPIPQKSDRLFTVNLDNLPLDSAGLGDEVPDLLSWIDVQGLRELKPGIRRSGMFGIGSVVTPADPALQPFFGNGLAVDADFFAMMDIRFRSGDAWTAAEDDHAAQVAVIDSELAERVFGSGVDAVGRDIRVNNIDWRVVGVIEPFKPFPAFYSMGRSALDVHDVFLPLSSALARETDVNGNISCSADAEPGYRGLMASECVWLRLWIETASAADRVALGEQLRNYVAQQKTLGRLPRPDRSQLYDVMQWLDHQQVVSNDTRIQTWLSFGFLSVCLVNAVGLLLAKFGARAGVIAIHRALGASRAQIFLQYLIESAVLGLAGSVVGLILAIGLLQILALRSDELQHAARMDFAMLGATVALSVLSAIVAGLLPTWRATQVRPAAMLKAQ